MSDEAREPARHPDRPVIELECGTLVYPPEADREPWRAVFTENGQRRYRQGATNAAPTAGEGDRVHGMLSALVAAGIEGRTSPCLQRSRQRVSHPQALTIPQPFPGSAHCISQQATTHARLPARTLQPTLSS